jgi:hypothetical protein
MDSNEVSYDIEKSIDFAFSGKFVLNFYDYLKIKEVRKKDIDSFLIESTTIKNIYYLITELDEYMEGGNDKNHKQIREAYKHIPKPQARKIRNFLMSIINDGFRYSNDKKPGRKKKTK